MELFEKIWPLVLATAFSPTMLVFGTLVLTTRHGRSRLIAYIAGWTAAVGVLGIVAAFGAASATHKSPVVSGTIDVVLGFVLLAMTAATLWSSWHDKRHPKPPKPKKPQSDSPRLAAFFAMGIAGLLVDISSIIPYMAAAKDIGIAAVSAAEKALAAGALWFFITLPLLVPLGITIVAPKQSQKILDAMVVWLKKRGVALGVAVMLVISAYLIVRGGIALRWW